MNELFYIRFWGPHGLFSNPLHPVERQTYPFPTHSALRNMIGAIFWKPEMHEYGGTGYQITRIAVKNPIVTSSLTRNEVTEVIKRKLTPINVNEVRRANPRISGVRTQRNSVILRDVEYVVEFYINFPTGTFKRTDGETSPNYWGKYRNQLLDRLDKGICYHDPYMGCREFTAAFQRATPNDMIIDKPRVPNMTIPLMLYEVQNLENISEIKPTFCPIELRNGIVSYPTWNQLKNK